MKNKIIILGMLTLGISAFAQETGSKKSERRKSRGEHDQNQKP